MGRIKSMYRTGEPSTQAFIDAVFEIVTSQLYKMDGWMWISTHNNTLTRLPFTQAPAPTPQGQVRSKDDRCYCRRRHSVVATAHPGYCCRPCQRLPIDSLSRLSAAAPPLARRLFPHCRPPHCACTYMYICVFIIIFWRARGGPHIINTS